MRKAKDAQSVLDFQPATLKLTAEHHRRYEEIDRILKAAPEILALVHRDLEQALERANRQRNRSCQFTSDNVLRLAICQIIEGVSLREIVVRVDDSNFLRRFTGIHGGMMGHTAFCRLKNEIKPETWREVVGLLAEYAVANELVTGDKLRIDTTAYETNIHYPTDSSLLFDVYRVIDRLVKSARKIDPSVAEGRRLQLRAARKRHVKIARKVGKRTKAETIKPHYEALLGLVEGVLEIGAVAVADLQLGLDRGAYDALDTPTAKCLIRDIRDTSELGVHVVEQTKRRVLLGEKVPNDEKLFSIFEPHTELLKRGKAGKPIEFGHMVLLAQTGEKFITDYDAFQKRPAEHELVDGVLANHLHLFGALPSTLAADRGFYESMETIEELEQHIDFVAIGKKGIRTAEERDRETSFGFKLGQAFRSGIEGTISFLKRSLRMHRCFNKGWEHYLATVGATVFAHNLLVLVRGGG